MIAIKNMKVPERCAKCKFCINERTNDYGSFGECSLLKRKKVNCLVWRRDDSCPLVEIVTCKDCTYNNENTCDLNGYGINDDYFCTCAERKKEK
ncbi:hypothetical protein [Lachnospira multipara]|uniref:hypothetical protein n=1 Tax=Lachnospira multipara TaxID=28051 RepID=UPI00048254FC|nr:hypothetical protein [Lachnospira multipara]